MFVVRMLSSTNTTHAVSWCALVQQVDFYVTIAESVSAKLRQNNVCVVSSSVVVWWRCTLVCSSSVFFCDGRDGRTSLSVMFSCAYIWLVVDRRQPGL